MLILKYKRETKYDNERKTAHTTRTFALMQPLGTCTTAIAARAERLYRH